MILPPDKPANEYASKRHHAVADAQQHNGIVEHPSHHTAAGTGAGGSGSGDVTSPTLPLSGVGTPM